MGLPHFREFIPPVLTFGAEHDVVDTTALRNWLPDRMHLSQDAIEELRPSGIGTRYVNLISWAVKTAAEEGLLEKLGQGRYRLTDQGRALLLKSGYELQHASAAGGSDAVPVDYDPWFAEVATKVFQTERAVEIRFILPLLERLGYSEDDRSDGHPVYIHSGSQKTRKEADFVVFAGPEQNQDTSLMVIEAKSPGSPLKYAVDQAVSYQRELRCILVMVTDGNVLEVHEPRPQASNLRHFMATRADLGLRFTELQKIAGGMFSQSVSRH